MTHAAHPTMSRKATMMKNAPRPEMCAIVGDVAIPCLLAMSLPGEAGSDEVKVLMP